VLEGSDFQDRQRDVVRERTSDVVKALRSQLDTRTAGVRGKATETFDNLEEMLQARVLKALQQLGVPSSNEIEALSRKVKELNRSVQALTQTKGAGAGRKRALPAANAGQQGAVV
jgi:poly(hydroxyalkanoate) granule-associated protein